MASRHHKSPSIHLRDGEVCYQEYGAPDGEPFFYCHGLPGSRRECELLDRAARRQGMRVISIDRPGYGGSPPQPGRSLCNWPDTVCRLADRLQLDRFGVIGISGGGPYALACARFLPERLTAVGVVCGLGPLHGTGLADTLHWHARQVFRLAAKGAWGLLGGYGQALSLTARIAPLTMIRSLGWLLGGKDRRLLADRTITESLAHNVGTAFAQGTGGVIDDLRIASGEWGFQLSDIGIPVHLWHGTEDRLVHIRHSEHVHKQVSGSTLERVTGEGHFSLPIRHTDSIVATLLATR